jgi:hypothetical protein
MAAARRCGGDRRGGRLRGSIGEEERCGEVRGETDERERVECRRARGGGGAAGVFGCGWLEVVPTDAKDKLTGVA